MKILILCKKVPYPPTDGESVVIMNDIRMLKSLGHEIFLFCLNTKKHYINTENYSELEFWDEFYSIDIDTNSISTFLNAIYSKFPLQIARFYSIRINNFISRFVIEKGIDTIIYQGLAMTQYQRERTYIQKIYRVHNIEHNIWNRIADNAVSIVWRTLYSKISNSLQQYEEYISDFIDKIVTLSDEESEYFQSFSFKKNISIGVSLKSKFTSEYNPKNEGLLFIGSLDWAPNREGLNWFLVHIYTRISEIPLTIAGKGSFDEYNFPNLKVISNFENLENLLNSHRMMIVPLLSGAGIRIKILEGMHFGIPIISTKLGAEGILFDAKDMIIEDEINGWISEIRHTYHNAAKLQEMSKSSKFTYLETYSEEKVMAKWNTILNA